MDNRAGLIERAAALLRDGGGRVPAPLAPGTPDVPVAPSAPAPPLSQNIILDRNHLAKNRHHNAVDDNGAGRRGVSHHQAKHHVSMAAAGVSQSRGSTAKRHHGDEFATARRQDILLDQSGAGLRGGGEPRDGPDRRRFRPRRRREAHQRPSRTRFDGFPGRRAASARRADPDRYPEFCWFSLRELTAPTFRSCLPGRDPASYSPRLQSAIPSM